MCMYNWDCRGLIEIGEFEGLVEHACVEERLLGWNQTPIDECRIDLVKMCIVW